MLPPSKLFEFLVLRSCRNIALPVSPTPNGDIHHGPLYRALYSLDCVT